MKNKLLQIGIALVLVFSVTKIAQGQVLDILSDPSLNYYQTVEQVNLAIKNLPTTKSIEEEKEIKRFDRWNWFWQHRADAEGNYDTYGVELIKYYKLYTGTINSTLPLCQSIGPTHKMGALSNGGEIGMVNFIWADPAHTDTIIIGSSGGGLWKSTNAGVTWTQLGKETIHSGALAIAVDPSNTNTLYVGCGLNFNGFSNSVCSYSTGVYKSTNGGQTFTQIDNGLPLLTEKVAQIKIHPTNPSELLILFRQSIYRSVNAGTSWQKVHSITEGDLLTMAYDPNNPSRVFAAGTLQLIKSTNAGVSWSNAKGTIPLATKYKFTVDVDKNNKVYTFFHDFSNKRGNVYSSPTQSLVWKPIFKDSTAFGSADYMCQLKISPEGNIFVGGVSVIKYNPMTNTKPQLQGLHADIRDICFANGVNEDVVYVAHDGGVSKSTDIEGLTYAHINSDLALNESYDVAIHQDYPELMVIGVHDNHSFIYNNQVWDNISGGDGGYCLISKSAPNVVFTLNNKLLKRSDNYGIKFSETVIKNLTYNGNYAQNPVDPTIMYAYKWKGDVSWTKPRACIVRSYDMGITWDTINPFASNWGHSIVMGMCETNPDYFYYASIGSNSTFYMYKVTNNGTTSTPIFEALKTLVPNGVITSIYVDPANPNLVMVSIANFLTQKKIFYSNNGGTSWNNYSEGLPNLPVNKIIIDKLTAVRYAATDVGVFYRNSGATSWLPFNNGLPLVMVTDLEINQNTRELIISTYGRGVWKACLDCTGATEFVVKGTQNWNIEHQICGGLKVATGASLTLNSTIKIPSDKNITIESGGELIIDSGNFLNTTGQQYSGSIVIKSGGKLVMSSDSEFKIGTSGSLVVESGGSIQCTKNTIISCYGYIKLNGNINGTTNLTIKGTSKTTKLLELEKLVVIDVANFTLKNGTIQMNNSISDLNINCGVGNVAIDNVKVTSPTSKFNGHMGIDIRGTGNVSVNNSTFEYGEQGLYFYRSSGSLPVNITNSIFSNCTMGLYGYNGSVNVSGCSFTGNTLRAMICQSMDNYSQIKNSTFTNNIGATAVYYTGSSSTSLYVEGCTIDNNKYGILNYGPFSFSMYCSSSTNNDYYGVQAYDNASLNIDYCNLYGNKYAIEGAGSSVSNKYNLFNLDEGFNDLRDDGTSGSYCMYGFFQGYSSGTIAADNNYWKTGGGVPINNTDYVLYGSSYYLTLSDNSPNNYKPSCTVSKSTTLNLMGESKTNEEDGNYREIVTSIGTMPLNEALTAIIGSNDKEVSIYNQLTQYKLLGEILLNNLDNLNPEEDLLIKHTYRLYKTAIGKLDNEEKEKKNAIVESLKVIRKLQKDIEKAEIKENQNEISPAMFAIIIDEANVLRLLEDYDGAIQLLQEKLKKLSSDDACHFEELICIIGAEKQMAANNNNGDIDALLESCTCKSSQKSAEINQLSNEETDKSENLSIDDYSLTVMPNPITNASEIKVCGYEGAELVIYNSSGQSVINEMVASNNYTKTVSNIELGEGVYMVVVIQNGNTVLSEKIVVVK